MSNQVEVLNNILRPQGPWSSQTKVGEGPDLKDAKETAIPTQLFHSRSTKLPYLTSRPAASMASYSLSSSVAVYAVPCGYCPGTRKIQRRVRVCATDPEGGFPSRDLRQHD